MIYIYPKHTTIKVEKSIVNGIQEERPSLKDHIVKVQSFREDYRKFRSSPGEVFLAKGALKICSKFTGEHPCQSVTSIKSQSNFIEIIFWDGCSPVNLLHIFSAPFLKNTSGGLLLKIETSHFPHNSQKTG